MEKVVSSIPLGRMVLWVLFLVGVVKFQLAFIPNLEDGWRVVRQLSLQALLLAPLAFNWLRRRGGVKRSIKGVFLWRDVPWIVLLVLGAALVAFGLTWLISLGLGHFFPELHQVLIQKGGRALDLEGNWAVFWMISLLIGAPLGEEFIFRGVLLSRMRLFGFRKAALLLSAGLFALIHGDMRIPGLFFFGFAAAWAVVKTGKLSTAVWMHFGLNLASTLLTVIPESGRRYLVSSPWALGVLLTTGLGILAYSFSSWPISEKDWEAGRTPGFYSWMGKRQRVRWHLPRRQTSSGEAFPAAVSSGSDSLP